jgi:hypothetical protein
MKKYLLSLAAALVALTASATSYTVFDIANPGSWSGDANGYTQTLTVNGATFTITSDKSDSTTDLIAPDSNSYSWRVYKGSSVTIESSVAIQTYVITFDDYVSGSSTYNAEMTLSDGWTGSLDEYTYTVSSAGLKTLTAIAEAQQVRIETIVASTDATEPVVSNVVYENTFTSSIDDWTVEVESENSTLSGWYVTNYGVNASAYVSSDDKNYKTTAKLYKSFDLSGRKNCELSFDQAFGRTYPTEDCDNYVAYIAYKDANTEENMVLSLDYPDAPTSGNYTKFVTNTFDISEYDGETIEIGFIYTNDGSVSRIWEIKNFKITGEAEGSVATISADENVAPVYYNLQGVRVANPEKGLYIQVRGNKATKIAF